MDEKHYQKFTRTIIIILFLLQSNMLTGMKKKIIIHFHCKINIFLVSLKS